MAWNDIAKKQQKGVTMETVDKRQWLRRAFRNEAVEAVPVGFWFHFTRDEVEDVFTHPEMLEQNLGGHRKYYRDFRPDFVKIMSDGFFVYPNPAIREARKAEDLYRVQSIGADHPWIERQVALVKTLTAFFGGEVLSFYNIFSPATFFRFARLGLEGAPSLMDMAAEDPGALRHALEVAAEDLALLARRVVAEGGAEGIYFSVQDQGDSRFTAAVQREVFRSADLRVLAGAREGKADAVTMLHICGYEGHRNKLEHYVDYPAQVINWACTCEQVPLEEGKKLFGGRCVLGGFDNTVKGVLYRGTEGDIKAETRRLLTNAGRTGVVLGADCTVPRDIDLKHLQWVRDAAAGGAR
jgi:uroporphyrinogen decarboxylase